MSDAGVAAAKAEVPPTPGQSLRVLHLHAGNMMGGIESMLITLAECGHLCPELQQYFALTFDSAFAAQLRGKGATVHLLPQVRLRYPPSIYQSRRQLRSLLSEFHFDAVISHSTWIQLIFADVVHGCGLPLVLWMHGPFDGHWLQKLASFQAPDFAICNSRWTRSTLERCYPRVPSAVIYCPVSHCDVMGGKEIRSELGIQTDEVVILIAARMEPWKGHEDLLRALGKIWLSQPWRLLIAGAGNSRAETDYIESLQREATALGIGDRVHFLGHRSDVSALLSDSDIYCQPNRAPEPFGIVFVEALRGGVPVVTSAMGGARDTRPQYRHSG